MELRIYDKRMPCESVAYLRLIKMMDDSVVLSVVDHNGQVVSGGPIVTVMGTGVVVSHRTFI